MRVVVAPNETMRLMAEINAIGRLIEFSVSKRAVDIATYRYGSIYAE
jgi:hypothetical protein